MYWRGSLRYRGIFLVAIVSVILASAVNAFTPLYFKKFFDLLASDRTASAARELVSVLLTFGFLRLVQWLFWRSATFSASYVQSKVMTDLTDHCFAYLQKHSFGFFTDNFVGSLVKKIKWFSRSYEVISDRVIWNLLPLVVSTTIITIVLSQRNTWLGIGVVVWLAVFFAVNAVFIRYKLKYDIARSEAETKATGFMADTITNQSTIKLFDGYRREVGESGRLHETLRRLRLKTWNFGNLFEAAQGFLMIVLEVAIFWIAVRLWQRGLLTVGDFVLIQSYLIYIFSQIWDFGKIFRQIYESLADAEEMTGILETPHEVQNAKQATELRVTDGRITFDRVDFWYRQTRPILRNFSMTIEPHQRLAIVGPSGAGKTTLVKLLLRMHDVSGGRVTIDGQDLARVTLESHRRQIALVPQDPILFHRSLLENIRYGKPTANDDQVIAAATAAHCHEFISRLPEQYKTYVGERGVKLSSGERQRVAIARAILYDAPILILDEATSSLDSESERLIQDALEKLMRRKTVIAIAHRLSTIRKMDRIVVLERGSVVEDGTHAALVDQPQGLYRHLWQLQAGGFI